MTPLYTEEQFNNSRSRGLLPLRCEHCNETFYKIKSQIQATVNGGSNRNRNKYCSRKCAFESKITEIKAPCGFCGTIISRDLREVKKSRTGFNFCNNSCAAKYVNSHKKNGTRVSKLEVWLSKKLKELYPNFDFKFNKTDAINAELDIYISELKLAFELNGIFHYEPVFGKDKLEKTKNNDERKFQACIENEISLCVIDTSKQVRFTEKSSIVYWNIVQEIIEKQIEYLKKV